MKLKSNKDSRLPSKQRSAKSLLLAKRDPICEALRCDQSGGNRPSAAAHTQAANNTTFAGRNSLALEEIPVVDLKPHPNNARKHSRQQIRCIRRSLEKFGQFRPIVANDSNQIISGHAVVEAAKGLGLTHLLVLRISHLTEDQVRQIVLADNQLALKGHWDRKDLQREVQYFVSIGVDFESIGFDVTETEVILSEEFNVDPQGHEDLVPSPSDKSIVSQPGDIWLLGDHVLMCGNALELTAYHALMGDAQAKMVFADPPYNVKIQGHVSGLGRTKHREFAMGSGEFTQREYRTFLSSVCQNVANYSFDGSLHYFCIDWRHMGALNSVAEAVFTGGLKNVCVWVKTNAGMGSFYRSQHEFVLVYQQGSAPHTNNVELGRHGRTRTNVWEYAGVNTFKKDRMDELSMHPTVKPVALVADAIRDCTLIGSIVLDPFAGSGTTIIAAERTGRRARTLEIDPAYVDVAVRRWQTYSGRSAVHAASGRAFDEIFDERISQREIAHEKTFHAKRLGQRTGN